MTTSFAGETVLLVELIRIHFSRSETGGFIRALYDEPIARTLALIHARPQEGRTLDGLAREAAMSGSAYAARFKELVGSREEVKKKLGIKMISAYTSTLSHLIFIIVDAPSQQAVESFLIESGFAFWNNVEILTQVQPVEDVIKRVVG